MHPHLRKRFFDQPDLRLNFLEITGIKAAFRINQALEPRRLIRKAHYADLRIVAAAHAGTARLAHGDMAAGAENLSGWR
ncbi:MAG: hypothetical protein ACR2OZ_04095 [Verrucomicrobiales bacterium]